jgi:hypothetical protein
MLTSIVIDHLTTQFRGDSNVGIAYLYCNYYRQGDQKAEDLFSDVLKQLVQGLPSMPQKLRSFYERHEKHHTRPSIHDLSDLLQSVAAMHLRVFIIIDALDECQTLDGCQHNFLTKLLDLHTNSLANIFVTSRPIPDIVKRFAGVPSLQILATTEDIQQYLQGHMGELGFDSC